MKYTGWHTGYPDAPVRVLPDSCRTLPFEDDRLFFLGEFAPPAEAVCPRALLRRVLERGTGAGLLGLHAASSTSSSCSRRRPESVRAKDYRELSR